MAQDGIYDLASITTRSCGRCCAPGTWFQLQDLRREAEQARERLAAHLAKINRIASRFEPSGCGPPMPKSVRHDLQTTESGCSNSCWA